MAVDLLERFSSFATRAVLALLLLTATAGLSRAQESVAKALPFSAGEELVYQAEFKRGLLHGVDVAEFRFNAKIEHVPAKDGSGEDPVVVRLVGDVASKGLFTRVAGFHFHQHVESTVDPSLFAALRTSKLVEQGKRARLSEAVFDHQAHKVTWSERDPNQTNSARTTVLDFSEPIQDVLTLIYFVRTQPLQVGKSFDVPVSDSGRVFHLSVPVVERKQIDSVLGRVNAVRVEPKMFGEGGMVRSRGTLSIWLTDDNRHLPVKAQLKVDAGTFDIKLKRINYAETKRPG